MFINIKTITSNELKTLSLKDLVSICKSLDNSNGNWHDVTSDEYSDILQTAINLINEFKN